MYVKHLRLLVLYCLLILSLIIIYRENIEERKRKKEGRERRRGRKREREGRKGGRKKGSRERVKEGREERREFLSNEINYCLSERDLPREHHCKNTLSLQATIKIQILFWIVKCLVVTPTNT